LATPGDILAGPDFAALIGGLRERFDLVILDGPPLCHADAMALVGLTDGVLLAVNFVRTNRSDAVRAVDVLREMKARIVGVVVNEAAAETLEAAGR
jgi:Mrp family chromosome partitioning ATPase